MKKIISLILVTLTICACFVGCGDNNTNKENLQADNKNESSNIDNNSSNKNTNLKYWYEEIDLESLKTKDFSDFKIANISGYPFIISDFRNDVKNIDDKVSIDNLFEDNDGVSPSFSTTNSYLFLTLNNDIHLRFNFTGNSDEWIKTKECIDSKYYFYHSDYKIEELLNINMSRDTEYSNNWNNTHTSNAKPLLNKIIEKFGKPSEIRKNYGDKNEYLEYEYYDVIYENDIFVIDVGVYESKLFDLNKTAASVNLKVFTKESWGQYEKYKKNNK